MSKSVSALSQTAELGLSSEATVCISPNVIHGRLDSEDLPMSHFLFLSLACPHGHSYIQSVSYSCSRKVLPLFLQECL